MLCSECALCFWKPSGQLNRLIWCTCEAPGSRWGSRKRTPPIWCNWHIYWQLTAHTSEGLCVIQFGHEASKGDISSDMMGKSCCETSQNRSERVCLRCILHHWSVNDATERINMCRQTLHVPSIWKRVVEKLQISLWKHADRNGCF